MHLCTVQPEIAMFELMAMATAVAIEEATAVARKSTGKSLG